MKKAFITITLFISTIIYSQDTPGNLQFNRVVNYTLDIDTGNVDGNGNNGHGIASTFSVPVGKVWKILNVFVGNRDVNRNNSVTSVNGRCSLTANRNALYMPDPSGTGNNSVKFPIWFSSGSYELYAFDCRRTALTLSAIEFNIVN